jgi:benzylsuccinate CoA-transferase BbsF subunit
MASLQAAGVPSGVVQTTADLIDRDPSLRERHWEYLDHPEMGRSLYDAPPFKLSRTPGRLRRPAPRLGEHTHEVLEGILGYSKDEIDALAASGVLR